MNVLFLSQIVPYPPHGGVLQRGYNLIREIAKKHTVHLIAWVHNDVLRTRESIEQSRLALAEFCQTIEYIDIWPKRSRWHRAAALMSSLALPEPFSVTAHRSSAAATAMQRMLQTHHIDVIHYDTIGLARYGRLGAGYGSVLTHHNVESELMARRVTVEAWPASAYLALQARKLRNWERRKSPEFDINLAMSKADEALLRSIAPNVTTAVVPNGVDVGYFGPTSEPREPALVFTGGMNMFANRDAVMHFVESIWPRIKGTRPDVRFDIIGQDPPPELIERSRVDPGLRVYGFVDDIRPYVSKASIYVVPIRVGGGTRLKVLDAMAMGKAIVSTRVGCEGIDATDGRELVIADGEDETANAILQLLDDTARRECLGAAARALVEARYAWGPIGERLSDIYQEVAERRRVGAGGRA